MNCISHTGWRRVGFAVGILALLNIASLAAAVPAAADPLPTQEEIRDLYKDGKYAAVLQKIARVLVLKGEAAKPYDRHELLRLKGETHLQLRATRPAQAAFGDAAAATDNPEAQATDTAMQLLVKRATTFAYVPKTHDKSRPAEPIPLLDPEKRKLAFSAIFKDEMGAVTPKVKAVRDSKSLAPIMEVMPAVHILRSLEVAATGHDDETKKLVSDMAQHARDLMTTAVDDFSRKLDDIDKTANELLESRTMYHDANAPGGVNSMVVWRKRGLVQADTAVLKSTISTCDRIIPASRDLADAMGTEGKEFDGVRASAERVGHKAEALLSANYSGDYSNPNPNSLRPR